MQTIMFSKMLQPCESLEKVAELMADIGVEGADLTVRAGGHVLPVEVKEKLAEVVNIFRKNGLKVPMITTGVIDAEEEHSEAIYATAADCGVKYLKLGYWQYKGFGHLREQMEEVKRALDGLAKLSQKYGITSGMHIHSGNFISADGVMVWELIKDFNPKLIGVYLDPGHMSVEGARSGWKLALDILSDRIAMSSIKDLRVERTDNPDNRWATRVVPVGEGFMPWKDFFSCLARCNFDGPFTLHSEYDGLSVEELVAQTKKDFAYVKEIMKGGFQLQ